MAIELGSKFIEAYKTEVTRRLALSGIDTTQIDPERFHKYCMRTFKNEPCKLYNNVKQLEYDVTVMKIVEMVQYSPKKPIITGYNTIFHNHHHAENIPGNFLEYLKDSRDEAKGRMHHHQNDEIKTVYESLDREQKLFKLFANSYYGAFGQRSFHFFNVLLGPSVTAQGRQLISSAILGFEGFLTDNIYFHEFAEFSTFITNILSEDFDDELVLDTPYDIDNDLVFARLKSKCRFDLTEAEVTYTQMVIENASEGQKQKLYFKNNMFKFLECEEIMCVFRDELQTEDYHNPGKPPEDIKGTLQWLSDMLRYFVGYPYPYNHKTQHADEMIRKTVLVCDTDSNFLYVFPFLKWFCDISNYVPDELSKYRRVSIISIITFFITKFIDEVFARLNTNANVPQEHQHLINMKSELTKAARYKLL